MKMSGSAQKPKQKDGCGRHEYPCTCAMGHLYRFVEPVLLLGLKEKGRSYGYHLSGDLAKHAFTDGAIEKAVLYRTLRRLEINGFVTSDWDTGQPGPARRVYALTDDGDAHLREWAQVLAKVASSMNRFVRRVSTISSPSVQPRKTGKHGHSL